MMGATLIIACGALAREIDALKRANGWDQLQVQCLDAALHNRPKSIPAKVEALLEKHFHQYERVFVAYADCGTGGALDTVLARWGVSRLPGAHCYEVFATSPVFHALAAAEPSVWSRGMHCTTLLLATNYNSLPHEHPRHLCDLLLPTSNNFTPAAPELDVWSGGMHCTTLLPAAHHNALPHNNHTFNLCHLPLPSFMGQTAPASAPGDFTYGSGQI